MIIALKNETGRRKLLSIYGEQTINTIFPIKYCLNTTAHHIIFLSVNEKNHSNAWTQVPVWYLKFVASSYQSFMSSFHMAAYYSAMDCFDLQKKWVCCSCGNSLCFFYSILDAKMFGSPVNFESYLKSRFNLRARTNLLLTSLFHPEFFKIYEKHNSNMQNHWNISTCAGKGDNCVL